MRNVSVFLAPSVYDSNTGEIVRTWLGNDILADGSKGQTFKIGDTDQLLKLFSEPDISLSLYFDRLAAQNINQKAPAVVRVLTVISPETFTAVQKVFFNPVETDNEHIREYQEKIAELTKELQEKLGK